MSVVIIPVIIPWHFTNEIWSQILSEPTPPTPLHLNSGTPIAIGFHTTVLGHGNFVVDDGPLGSDLSPWSFFYKGFIAEPLGKEQFFVEGARPLFEHHDFAALATVATPEPATWLMLVLGLGALMLFGRRRPAPVKQEWVERRRRL